MAALLTPRLPDRRVDLDAVELMTRFALDRGVDGVVPCGGTGEYFDLPASQRMAVLERVVRACGGRGLVIAGVGSASARESVRLARHAFRSGADAVLLPPPHFYRYGDSDLRQFYHHASRKIGGPVLLYNLAGFVSPIGEDVAADLIASEENIVGIKDSSGTLDILRRLSAARAAAVRIQGHDLRLADSLREGLLDGAISGPASVVPELTLAQFESYGSEPAFAEATAFYREFIARMEEFPYPWALKWVAERRGLYPARLPFPPGPDREAAAERFAAFFDDWLDRFLRWRSSALAAAN